ncbi:MAG: hypothetical protein ACR2G2_00055, partial [Pseudonocardia sp.]
MGQLSVADLLVRVRPESGVPAPRRSLCDPVASTVRIRKRHADGPKQAVGHWFAGPLAAATVLTTSVVLFG